MNTHFVESVGRRVMKLEVVASILQRGNCWDTCLVHGGQVYPRACVDDHYSSHPITNCVQKFGERRQSVGTCTNFQAKWSPVAVLELDSSYVICQLGFMIVCAGAAAGNTIFFVHPGNEPNRPCRSGIYFSYQAQYIHGNANT